MVKKRNRTEGTYPSARAAHEAKDVEDQNEYMWRKLSEVQTRGEGRDVGEKLAARIIQYTEGNASYKQEQRDLAKRILDTLFPQADVVPLRDSDESQQRVA